MKIIKFYLKTNIVLDNNSRIMVDKFNCTHHVIRFQKLRLYVVGPMIIIAHYWFYCGCLWLVIPEPVNSWEILYKYEFAPFLSFLFFLNTNLLLFLSCEENRIHDRFGGRKFCIRQLPDLKGRDFAVVSASKAIC